MKQKKCPDCGSKDFYVKDPQDQFNTSEFSLEKGTIDYTDEQTEEDQIPVLENTEIFCDRCAWHDNFKSLK